LGKYGGVSKMKRKKVGRRCDSNFFIVIVHGALKNEKWILGHVRWCVFFLDAKIEYDRDLFSPAISHLYFTAASSFLFIVAVVANILYRSQMFGLSSKASAVRF
jgi:hypothetical protein